MRKWLAALAIMILMGFLSMPTAFAAARLQTSRGATHHSLTQTIVERPNTSVINCSGYGCDDVYAYPSNTKSQGSNCGGTFVGWFSGEPEWSKIYYSSSCGTNFAYVTSSPDGSAIILVNFNRRPPGGNTAGGITSYNVSYFPYCASSSVYPPDDQNSYCDPDLIPSGAHSWMTNMLYAPVDQVQVCVRTVLHQNTDYCSYWH